jgi:hypothetical protein
VHERQGSIEVHVRKPQPPPRPGLRPTVHDRRSHGAALVLHRQLDDRRIPERERRNDRVAAILAVLVDDTITHRRRVQHRKPVVAREVPDVGSTPGPCRDAGGRRVAVRNADGNAGIAPVHLLEKQHELLDALASGEFSAPEPTDQIVDVAAPDVEIPRHDRQTVDRVVGTIRGAGLEEDRADSFAPA